MEYITPSLRIVATMGMGDETTLADCMDKLVELEEDHFIA